ncbi:MAG TPA: N-acetyltransferase [Gemmata sp.]|jgi:L-amino acid N-acyltransferase YncA|nr:N-acetyltransferase [Gemmata sp.]
MITIREATEADWPAIWAIFQIIAAEGDVFAYDESTTEVVARKLWFDPPVVCFVAEEDGRVVGSYFLRTNQPGRGSHVANGGYMVVPEWRGRGAASAMCEHSIATARHLGFTAMQFNFVIESNAAALRVWQKHGFAVVGRLPLAFRHKELGFVDALVMYRTL